MVRQPLSNTDRERGAALGRMLRAARGSRSIVAVAAESGISPETLRKIERGAICTPAFFTIVALAGSLDIDLAVLARLAEPARMAS